jgi:hypothetical protein
MVPASMQDRTTVPASDAGNTLRISQRIPLKWARPITAPWIAGRAPVSHHLCVSAARLEPDGPSHLRAALIDLFRLFQERITAIAVIPGFNANHSDVRPTCSTR